MTNIINIDLFATIFDHKCLAIYVMIYLSGFNYIMVLSRFNIRTTISAHDGHW